MLSASIFGVLSCVVLMWATLSIVAFVLQKHTDHIRTCNLDSDKVLGQPKSLRHFAGLRGVSPFVAPVLFQSRVVEVVSTRAQSGSGSA